MLKKISISLGLLIAIVAILGVIAPTDFVIEREIVVNKPKAFVFNEIRQLKKHGEWSPWEKRDPNMKKEFKGEDGTVGFVTSWSGNSDVGVGEQEITSIVDGEKIETVLRFKEPMESTSEAVLTTEVAGEGQTKVKWLMTGHNKFPFSVVCMLMGMKNAVGKDFEAGLSNLKTILEK